MEYKRMDLCRPCAEALKAEGKNLRRVRDGIDNKVSCVRCQLRRYGMTYELVDTKSKA